MVATPARAGPSWAWNSTQSPVWPPGFGSAWLQPFQEFFIIHCGFHDLLLSWAHWQGVGLKCCRQQLHPLATVLVSTHHCLNRVQKKKAWHQAIQEVDPGWGSSAVKHTGSCFSGGPERPSCREGGPFRVHLSAGYTLERWRRDRPYNLCQTWNVALASSLTL